MIQNGATTTTIIIESPDWTGIVFIESHSSRIFQSVRSLHTKNGVAIFLKTENKK